jgi:3-oxoacyl-(acyl-carrier-protein) synthase
MNAMSRSPVVITGYGAMGFPDSLLDETKVQNSLRHRKSWKVMDTRTRLALGAALQAAAMAGISPDRSEGGVALGVGWTGPDEPLMASLAGRAENPQQDGAWMRLLEKELPPLWLLERLPNMPAAHLAIQFQACGPCHTNATARAAGLQAIALAARWIASGETPWALAGGVEAPLSNLGAKAWHEMWPDTPHQEGALLLVLENRELAAARGAVILADLEPRFLDTPRYDTAREPGAVGGLEALLRWLTTGPNKEPFSIPAESDCLLHAEASA